MHEQHEHRDERAEGKTNGKLRGTIEPNGRARESLVLIEIRKNIVDGQWSARRGHSGGILTRLFGFIHLNFQ